MNLIFISLQMQTIVATKNSIAITIGVSIHVYILIHIMVRLYHIKKNKDVNIYMLMLLLIVQFSLYGVLFSYIPFPNNFITFLILSNAYNFYEIFLRCINNYRNPSNTSATIEISETVRRISESHSRIVPQTSYFFKTEQHACEENCKDCPCSICLENIDTLTRLDCGHCLHIDCIEKMIKSSKESKIKCPLCRTLTELQCLNNEVQLTNNHVVIIVDSL